ncbi:winged helix-turn-helix domain-containing protein [Actinoplanes siamensis]|uniref:Helix-turn-helix protein n=1 Tax=Actinoplanes siamensis TaxID=1223317 RepID=A0A919NCN3_9ACTN|nr:winged helix-turn-helix domain-containing protein [Actinoplanes siamensis]GIF08681.1 hypothetical protein Asi03nite_62190 [Actinoplanes siamensis]
MTTNAHDLGVTVGAWNALVRRARISDKHKLSALIVSSYADADGTGIHCGVARLALDLGGSQSTARRYLKWLRDVGLIELVRPGNRRKRLSDEYRLILGPDILEHVEVVDPATYDAARDEIRDANRAGARAREARARVDQRSSKVSAGEPDQRSSRVSADEVTQPVDNSDQRSSKVSADPEDAETISAHPGRALKTSISAHLEHDQRSPMDERPPSLNTYPEELTSPLTDDGDLEAAVTHSRANGEATNPVSSTRPDRCVHGLGGGRRDDGTPECALCRRGAPAADPAPEREQLATVIPFPTRRAS